MNLTSTARVKAYLGITSSGSDTAIDQLIARVSDQVIRWCSRPFLRTTYSGVFLNGTGSQIMRLPDSPIISLSSVILGGSNGTTLSESADGNAAGYQYDDKYLYLFGGYLFPMGHRNIVVSYVAGFNATQDEFVPAAPGPYTVTPTDYGYAMVDQGVTYTVAGTALTKVGSAPAVGQYTFSAGVYTFAAADAGVSMDFDYSPGAVEQAVMEMCGADLKQRDNLGISSKTLRDESISYSDKAMSNSVVGLLMPYKKILPL